MTPEPGDHYQPWSLSGCTYEVAHRKFCGADGVTVDGISGRRCSEHAPTFDAAKAVQMAVTGWTDTASAYCRSEIDGAA